MEHGEGGKGKENGRASVIHNIRCGDRGYKDVY
jgi:hypothetical protein